MKYSTVGESGGNYTVEILRGSYYARLIIYKGLDRIYSDFYLPICNSRIECEDNAKRIAEQYIK